MKFQEKDYIRTSTEYGIWFQPHYIADYKPSITLSSEDYISPLIGAQKQDGNVQIKSNKSKGFTFQKAQKLRILNKGVVSPGPAFYTSNDKILSIKDYQKGQQKKIPIKPQRFLCPNKGSSVLAEVGQYNLQINCFGQDKKAKSMSKAERDSYFQNNMVKALKTPGPGQYQVQKILRTKSLRHFNRSDNLSEHKNKKKQGCKPGIGPQSYNISRSTSVCLGIVMKKPYKQNDQKMKKNIQRLQKQRESTQKTGPGKYLKIQEWGKFEKSKQISNGLKNIYRPVLRIYN